MKCQEKDFTLILLLKNINLKKVTLQKHCEMIGLTMSFGNVSKKNKQTKKA